MAQAETDAKETKEGADESGFSFNWNVLFAVVMAAVVWSAVAVGGYLPNWWQTIGILLLCYPWKIGDNIWSLFGGINNQGSIYSLFGVYQNARKTAFQVSGLCLFQKGFDVFQLFGFCVFQNGRQDAHQGFGLCLIQVAEESAAQGIGLCVVQHSKGGAFQMLGICVVQYGEAAAEQPIGFCGWQIGEILAGQGIGFCFLQYSNKLVVHGCGLCVCQEARSCVSWPLSVVVFKSLLPSQ